MGANAFKLVFTQKCSFNKEKPGRFCHFSRKLLSSSKGVLLFVLDVTSTRLGPLVSAPLVCDCSGIRVLEQLRIHRPKGSFSSGGKDCPLALVGTDAQTRRGSRSGGVRSHTSAE